MLLLLQQRRMRVLPPGGKKATAKPWKSEFIMVKRRRKSLTGDSNPNAVPLVQLHSGKMRWTMDPRSKVASDWDLVVAVALIFTATVTPVEVGFMQPADSWKDGLFQPLCLSVGQPHV